MKRLLIMLMLALTVCGFAPGVYAADDSIQCTETEKRVICNLSIGNFIQSARSLLTNGWENSLQIQITLLDGSGTKTLI